MIKTLSTEMLYVDLITQCFCLVGDTNSLRVQCYIFVFNSLAVKASLVEIKQEEMWFNNTKRKVYSFT